MSYERGTFWWLLTGHFKSQSHSSNYSEGLQHIMHVITIRVPVCVCVYAVMLPPVLLTVHGCIVLVCLCGMIECTPSLSHLLPHQCVCFCSWRRGLRCAGGDHSPAIWQRRWARRTAPGWACSRRPRRWTPWLCQPAWRRGWWVQRAKGNFLPPALCLLRGYCQHLLPSCCSQPLPPSLPPPPTSCVLSASRFTRVAEAQVF